LTLKQIKQQKSKLFLMLFVGNIFHQTIDRLSGWAIASHQAKKLRLANLLK